MTQQEIQERNKEIALMLGTIEEKNFFGVDSFFLPQFERETWSNRLQDYFDNPHFTLSDLWFHSEWNWLMEAVDFIENKNYHVWIGKYASSITKDSGLDFQINSGKGLTKKEAVFLIVSDFAKKYNNKEL
jgi:hypothetical protein